MTCATALIATLLLVRELVAGCVGADAALFCNTETFIILTCPFCDVLRSAGM